MNPRTTAILALVVAALGAFVYFYEIRGSEQRAEAEAEAKRLFPGVEAAEITSVELLTSDGQDAVLERAPSGWRLREPRDFPADGPALNGLVSVLAGLTSEAVFEEPAPLEDYGLGEEVRVRFRAGGEEYVVRVGDKTPVGGNTYLATAADAPVYAVASYRANALTKALEELQDKRIAVFDRDAVSAIDASWPGGAVRLVRADEGWRVTEPLEDVAEELGLERPEFRAELEFDASAASEAGEEPLRMSVSIGASLDGDNRAVRGAEDAIRYSVAASRLDRLPRKIGSYRFRELARFDEAEAERFELVFQDEAAGQSWMLTGQRGEAGWVTEPEAMSPVKVSTLLSRLARLRAVDVMAERLGPTERTFLRLTPPQVQVRVFGEAPAEGGEPAVLAEVSLGPPILNQGIPALRPDRETVYLLDYDLAEHIPVSLEALRNRFLAEDDDEAGSEDVELELPLLGDEDDLPLLEDEQ
jgi:hypothetical protein